MTGVAAGFVLLTVTAWSIAQRPPGVDRDLVFYGTVRSGEFIHEVTAAGSLYAPEIRSVTNRSEGVVERILVLAGENVQPDDILVELSSPNLQVQLADGIADLEAAEADEYLRQAEAADSLLSLRSNVADYSAAYQTALLEADAQELLKAENATSELEYQRILNAAEQQRRRVEAAQAQLDRYPETRAARDAAAAAKFEQQRRKVERLYEQVDDLHVRAGVAGVVQEIAVEEGQKMGAGTEVARVVNPHLLIARVRVSERDAPLVEVGQQVRLEMGRESIAGEVMRIDPAVSDRLVTVDVDLVGEPTRQLRPDLTVTARIIIDRVPETRVLERPPGLRDDAESVELFRMTRDGKRAERVTVGIGRISGRSVEVLSGLQSGDTVILTDMTDMIEEPVIRIR